MVTFRLVTRIPGGHVSIALASSADLTLVKALQAVIREQVAGEIPRDKPSRGR
jgi:hypothetical protein